MSAGVNDRFDFTRAVPPASELGPVHLIAAGGAGMSGVARLLLARGVAVSGSDRVDSPALQALGRAGARVHVGHDARHLGAAQTVLISSAIGESNPELVAARAGGLRVLHRAQGIAALLAGSDQPAVAVAGANGKTTTSAMLTVALTAAGLDPSYVLGSPIATGDQRTAINAGAGSGPFVVEADESDGSFLAYRPQIGIVTNIKPDHLDFYGDMAAIERGFAAFAGTIRRGGTLVTNADDPASVRLRDVARDAGRRVLSFGAHERADLRVSDIGGTGLTWQADVTWQRDVDVTVPAGTRHRLRVPAPGRHNVMNAAAALAAGTGALGVPPAMMLDGLAAFPGTHRRFQVLGSAGGVEVVDDYAHNADKVAALVRAGVGVAGGRRTVVVFQPHLYSRTQALAEGFADGLAAADVVLVLDVFGAREEPIPGVDGALVAGMLAERPDPPETHYEPDRQRALDVVMSLLRPGDLLLTVGAGDVTALGPQVLARLGSGQ